MKLTELRKKIEEILIAPNKSYLLTPDGVNKVINQLLKLCQDYCDGVKKAKCKHEWELNHTDWQFPSGYTGTAGAVEYAYWCCKKCLKVRKVEVK